MHYGREGMVWELRIGKEKELHKKKKKGLLLVCIVPAT